MADVKQYRREQKADKYLELGKSSDAKDEEDEGYHEWKAAVEKYALTFYALQPLSDASSLCFTGLLWSLRKRLSPKNIHRWQSPKMCVRR